LTTRSMTIVDVVALLHAPRHGCIACIVRNAGIARIARNDRNNCNDEETSNDGTAYSVLRTGTLAPHSTTVLCHFRTSSQSGTLPVGPSPKKWHLLPFLGPSPLTPEPRSTFDASRSSLKGPTHHGTFSIRRALDGRATPCPGSLRPSFRSPGPLGRNDDAIQYPVK